MSDDEAASVDVIRALLDGASPRRAAAALLLLHLGADEGDGEGDVRLDALPASATAEHR